MKQTAIEWLGNEITNRITRRNPHDTIIIQTQGEILIELIEQAKEMEKQQIIEAHLVGQSEDLRFIDEAKQEANEYYNETYKSE